MVVQDINQDKFTLIYEEMNSQNKPHLHQGISFLGYKHPHILGNIL